MVPTDGAHTKVEFLNACIKWFGKKDVIIQSKSSIKKVRLALKKFVHNSVVPADGAHTKVEFLNACIKRFGEKDVMNEIKK